MSHRREHGHTLVELMSVCVILVIFSSICAAMMRHGWQSFRVGRDYATDLGHCRDALHAIETDLRRAHATEAIAGGYRLRIADTAVDYRLAEGVLSRSRGAEERVVARRLAALDLTPRERLVDVRVELMRRSKSAPTAAVHTSILLQPEAAK